MRSFGADEPCVRALILAAGLGTRLRPLTDRVPKCLVEIEGRPLLDYWFDRLAAAGIRTVRVNTHHLPAQVRAYLETTRDEGFTVLESYEPTLLGSAGTVTANRDLADGASEILVIYGDNLSDVDLRALLAFHRGHPDPCSILLFHSEHPERCGIAELDEEGRVVSFVEKPKTPHGDLANAGVYVLSPVAYREMADMRGFDLGFDVLPRFVGRARGFVFDGYHRDVGTVESLAQARLEARRVFGAEEPCGR